MAYPLAYLWNERRILRRRETDQLVTQVAVLYTAVAGGTHGGSAVKDLIEELQNGAE